MHRNPTLRLIVAGLIVGFGVIPLFWGVAQEEGGVGFAAERLRELEQKASGYDFAVRRSEMLERDVKKLKEDLGAAKVQIEETRARFNPGRIEDLERKAMAYGPLKDQIAAQEKKIKDLERQLAEEKNLTRAQAEEIARYKSDLQGAENSEYSMKQEIEDLRKVVEELRQGHYEFYEVKKGETVETIAALPMIYNDAGKANVIRQWNRDRVKNIENLQPGEMLFIPRFHSTGQYPW